MGQCGVVPTPLCQDRTCPHPATYRGYCQAHARGRDKQIHRVGKKIYNSKRWAMTRRRYLKTHPICEDCGQVLAQHVHHKQDIGKGGDPYAMANLQALCSVCHGKETRARQAA